MFWYVYMYNRFFIYNINYVIKHILCYVVFITKMFEIKQNELNTHVCIICPGAGHPQPYFLSQTSQFLSQKYFALLDNVQILKSLMVWGYFTF